MPTHVAKGRKPARWAWTPELLTAEWEFFRHGLTGAVVWPEFGDVIHPDDCSDADITIRNYNDDWVYIATLYHPDQDTEEMTLLTWFNWPTIPGTYRTPGSYGFWNGSGDNYNVGFECDPFGTFRLKYRHNDSFTYALESLTEPYEHVWVVRVDGSQADAFKDGEVFTTNRSRRGDGFSTDSRKRFSTGGSPTECRALYLWNRELTSEEIRKISDDPYGPFRPRL